MERSNVGPESFVASQIEIFEKSMDAAAKESNIAMEVASQTLPSDIIEKSTAEPDNSISNERSEVLLTDPCESNEMSEENNSQDSSNTSVPKPDKSIAKAVSEPLPSADQQSNNSQDSSNASVSKPDKSITKAVSESLQSADQQSNNSQDSSNASVSKPDKSMAKAVSESLQSADQQSNNSQDSSNASVFKPDKSITKAVSESLPSADQQSRDAGVPDQNVANKQISLQKLSLKQLSESLRSISASHVDAFVAESLPKDPNRISVPDIKITDASDVEMDSDTEIQNEENGAGAVAEVKRKRKRASQKSGKEQMVEVDKKQKAEPSTNDRLDEENQLSYEERRATFYISSSELQRQRDETLSPETNERTRNCQTVYPCLASRKLHGSIITSSIFVAAVGVGLSNLARKGSAPEVFEIIGLSTTIISGIVGILSLAYCCILTFLPSLSSNQPFTDVENLVPMPTYTPMLPDEYIHESLNLETERAFRRQNNLSSPRTSAVAVRRQRKQDKTETVKMEIRSAMKSLGNALAKLETDAEKQPLLKDDEKDDSSD